MTKRSTAADTHCGFGLDEEVRSPPGADVNYESRHAGFFVRSPAAAVSRLSGVCQVQYMM